MNWRLILDGEYSGAQNMARDEALLRCADENTAPVLRFYNWNPACVSIGRLQKNFAASPVFDFVRRPTGGRAVLHREYLPRESRSVVGAYNWLSQGFIAGLEMLGVRAELASRQTGGSTPAAANCFQSASQCDFIVDGRKLIGAAQCRRHDVILQHGSILLEVEDSAWHQAIGGAMKQSVALRALGVLQSRPEIIDALCEGMRLVWNVGFDNSQFLGAENQMSEFLHNRKYALAAWNENGIDSAEI